MNPKPGTLNPKPIHRSHHRETYDLGDHLLLVATDGVATDSLTLSVPRKGEVCARLAAYWFGRSQHILPNHLVTLVESAGDLATYGSGLGEVPDLAGRALVVRKVEALPWVGLVTGYLVGPAMEEFRASGTVVGQHHSRHLVEGDPLPMPLFAAVRKGGTGPLLDFAALAPQVGEEEAWVMQESCLRVYREAETPLRRQGILLAELRCEFGRPAGGGDLLLIDELLTPNTARLWEAAHYEPAVTWPEFATLPLEEWLEAMSVVRPDAPLQPPPEVVAATSRQYLELYRLVTGETLGQ